MSYQKTCIAWALVASALSTPVWGCEQPVIGQICIFAFNVCPKGFYPANGQALSQTAEPALFYLLGTTYGSAPTGQFLLPNLNGRAPVGTTAQSQLGTALGQSEVMLQAAQVPVPAHTHPTTLVAGNLKQIVTNAQANLAVSGSIQSLTVTGQATLPVTGNALIATATPNAPTTNIVSPNATLTSPSYETADLYVRGDPGGGLIPIGPAGKSIDGTATGPITASAQDVVVRGTATGAVQGSLSAPAGTASPVQVEQNSPVAATLSVPTQSPALALTFCIAAVGTYPTLPGN